MALAIASKLQKLPQDVQDVLTTLSPLQLRILQVALSP